MFMNSRTSWLATVGLALSLGIGAASPALADEAQLIPVAKQAPAEVMVAQASDAPAAPAAQVEESAPVAGAEIKSTSEGKTPEKIEVTFEESEQDILTKQALEKLDVVIESLEFSNADLRNVIRIIGERLNINFIFDAEDIQGKVTLRLRNIRLRDALDSILTTRKLAIVPDDSGIFRIVPQERVGRKSVETRTEVIQLNWINAQDVQKTMEPFVSEDVGVIVANEESNSLIITDVPPQIEVVRNLITQIDIPERQVMIEARLADINIGKAREFSTNWSMSKLNEGRDWQEGTFVVDDINQETGLPILKAAKIPYADQLDVVNNLLEGFSMSGGKGTMAFGEQVSLFGNDYSINAAFTALENNNVVEILANPRVTTLNNVPAKIQIIERIPYIEAVQGPTQGTTVAEVEFEEAGVNIMAKPIITPNGFVRMEIELEQRIFRERVGGGALDPPAIDVRDAETNVIVEDKSTVVLGGLRQKRKLEGTDGLPWFSQIPLIGWLFKDKIYDQRKTELVLMMTPTIIAKSTTLTDQEQYWYDKIDNDWHLPDYFFDETKMDTDNQPGRKQYDK